MVLAPTNSHGRRLRKRYSKVGSHVFTFLEHPESTRRITMAASGNCGLQPHTAKSQVASVLPGVPTCSLECDPSLERQRDKERMRITRFSQS